MDYKTAAQASIDQLDAMLRDNALALHETASKSPVEWTDDDWKIVIFALHASAGRATYLKGELEDEEGDQGNSTL